MPSSKKKSPKAFKRRIADAWRMAKTTALKVSFWQLRIRSIFYMNLLKRSQKAMFREAVLTVKAFQHRPCVTYFFEAIFPELLNADFYGKTAFLEEIAALVEK